MTAHRDAVRFVESTAAAIEYESQQNERRRAEDDSCTAPTLVIHFSRPMNDLAEFFQWVAEQFRLPDYFGRNWDALEECWRDLGWLEPLEKIVLVFDALPLGAFPGAQQVFFDILRLRVSDRPPTGSPTWELIVASNLREQFEYYWRSAARDDA